MRYLIAIALGFLIAAALFLVHPIGAVRTTLAALFPTPYEQCDGGESTGRNLRVALKDWQDGYPVDAHLGEFTCLQPACIYRPDCPDEIRTRDRTEDLQAAFARSRRVYSGLGTFHLSGTVRVPAGAHLYGGNIIPGKGISFSPVETETDALEEE